MGCAVAVRISGWQIQLIGRRRLRRAGAGRESGPTSRVRHTPLHPRGQSAGPLQALWQDALCLAYAPWLM